MDVLAKSESVLWLSRVGDEFAVYDNYSYPQEPLHDPLIVSMSYQTHVDFGSPQHITVTIQPGDLLNEEKQ